MSFLLQGGYSSSSEEEDSDHDVSVSADAGKDASVSAEQDAPVAVPVLPSADSVLSSVSKDACSFQAPQKSSKSVAIEEFDIQKKRVPRSEHTDGSGRGERRLRAPYNDRQPRPPRTATDTHPHNKKEVNGKKRPSDTDISDIGAHKRDKKDAKERVKGQRMKGQAGIGSDFRSWKSETEMHMRQQFD